MNVQRITLVSFLTYFVLSAMLAPIGILSGPMAEHFDKPITEVTRQFGWLTGGILTGAIIALVIFDWVSLKRLFIGIYAIIALSLFSLFLIESLEVSSIVLGIVGLGSGIGLAGAALTISRTYDEDRRASMLVITDGCFSVAGFVCAGVATYLVSRHYGWSTTYQLLGLVAAIIVVLTVFSSFPATHRDSESVVHWEPWPPAVWLCVVSLFLYTLGQYSMLFWLPNFAETRLGATPDQAGSLVGQFWLGMFIAQVFVAWWVFRIGVRRLILIAATTTVLFSIPLWSYGNVEVLPVLALLWGFFNLSMLKAILSFATQLVSLPSARLVSLLLLGATTGTAISPFVTSQIVEATDSRTILMFGSLCYLALLVLIIVAGRLATKTLSTRTAR